MVTQPVPLLVLIIGIFEQCGIPYAVGGSMASSQHGEPRATGDVDILIDLPPEKIPEFVQALQPHFDVGEDSVRAALARGRTISLLHVEWLMKVDLFVAGKSPLDPAALARRRAIHLQDEPERPIWFVSPEDCILQKLDWFRRSEGVLERQLRDVAGVLKLQRATLDIAYLRQMAATLDLGQLLERSLEDAGLG